MKKRSDLKQASGIDVFCSCDRIVPAAELTPHPKNPKRHPDAQLDRYEIVVAGSAKKKGNGWRRAIVVSRLSGHIVKGNGAWQMAMRRGWDVPVEYQDYASEAEELRDLVADNRLSELAETDDAQLARVLSEIGSDAIDLPGFDESELTALLAALEEEPDLKPVTIPEPPKMAWVLIGIPLVAFGKINTAIESIAALPGVIVETTQNDQGAPDVEESR